MAKTPNVPIHAQFLVNSYGFFDDFTEFWSTSTTGRWTSTSTGGTNVIQTSGNVAGGVLGLVPSGGTPAANDAAYISGTNGVFQLVADCPIFFEAMIQYAEANTSNAEVVGAVGGVAGLGSAAIIGGAVVAGTVAVEGAAAVGRWVGLLGEKYELLTGTVIDWYGSVKRSAELEKQITGLEEAHKAYKEQMKERQEQTRSYYEGRDRIDESKQIQQQAARLGPLAEHFEKRLGDVDKVRTPRDLEQLQHASARDDQQFVKQNYDKTFQEKQQKLHQAVDQANATLQANLKNPTRRAVTFLGQPSVHDNRIDAEGQKKIDEQEAEYVPEGFWHGLGTPFRKAAGWFGKSDNLADQRLAGLELRKDVYDQKAVNPTVPDATPQAVDLQPQLSQQERALKLASQLRDVTRDRTMELQNQLQTMSQQVIAAQQQKLAAEQQVKGEQERVISQEAGLSMMTKGQQSAAATILKKFNETKHLSRDDALTLQKLGITQGAIGRGINETLAQGLDPELAKQFKAAGGEEELDKAQQRLTQSTSDLAEAQAQAKDTLQEFREALGQFKDASATTESAQEAVESTRAKMGGYQDPTGGRGEKGITEHREGVGGEKVQLAIEGARKEFVDAIHEIGDSISAVIGAVTAEARGTAQRIKQSQQ